MIAFTHVQLYKRLAAWQLGGLAGLPLANGCKRVSSYEASQSPPSPSLPLHLILHIHTYVCTYVCLYVGMKVCSCHTTPLAHCCARGTFVRSCSQLSIWGIDKNWRFDRYLLLVHMTPIHHLIIQGFNIYNFPVGCELTFYFIVMRPIAHFGNGFAESANAGICLVNNEFDMLIYINL